MYMTYICGIKIPNPPHVHFILYPILANTKKTIAQAIDRLVLFKELFIDNISQKKYAKNAQIISEYMSPILIDVNIPTWFLYSFKKK